MYHYTVSPVFSQEFEKKNRDTVYMCTATDRICQKAAPLLKQKRRFYIVYNLIDCLCYPIFIHPRCSSEPLL